MRSILIDAGPIIALFDRSDKYHDRIRDFLRQESYRLISTWPAITEASHMLDFSVKAQIGLLQWIHRGGVTMYDVKMAEIRRIIELTEKYDDLPMDLADATLVVAAEETGIRKIVSIDSDFAVYRTIGKESITNVFGG